MHDPKSPKDLVQDKVYIRSTCLHPQERRTSSLNNFNSSKEHVGELDGTTAMKNQPKPDKWEPQPAIDVPKPPPDPIVAQAPLEEKIFPFLNLSGEIRNQIYLDIIGAEVPRVGRSHSNPCGVENEDGGKFRPVRTFNTALFVVNHQINQEFSDVLWNVLSVEWAVCSYELDKEELRLFTSMKRLQRCKLIIDTQKIRRPTWTYRDRSLDGLWSTRVRDTTAEGLDIERTVFGLAHKLNRMPQLKEVHLEYGEHEDSYDESYWVRFRDGSLYRYDAADLKAVFGTELRGMKKVQISGSLCDECAALFASTFVRPKETLPEAYMQEPEKCIPRHTVPQWNDKIRGWV